jgi:hypothetical protein
MACCAPDIEIFHMPWWMLAEVYLKLFQRP